LKVDLGSFRSFLASHFSGNSNYTLNWWNSSDADGFDANTAASGNGTSNVTTVHMFNGTMGELWSGEVGK
jgi:hypothetical protein